MTDMLHVYHCVTYHWLRYRKIPIYGFGAGVGTKDLIWTYFWLEKGRHKKAIDDGSVIY